MKTLLKILFSSAVLFLCLAVNINAYEYDTDEIISEIYESVPQELDEDKIPEIDRVNFTDIFSYLFDYIGVNIPKSALEILAVCITVCIINSVCGALENEGLRDAFSLICCTAVSVFTAKLLDGAITDAVNAVKICTTFGTSVLPVLTTLLVGSLNVNKATALGTLGTLFFTVLEGICTTFLLPFFNFLYALSIMSYLFENNGINELSEKMSRSASATLTVLMSIFGIVLHFQSGLSGNADTIAQRGMKLAASSAVPIVGNAVGDASEAVLLTLTNICKNSGGFCVFIILLLILPPLIRILILTFVLDMCGSISDIYAGKSGKLLFSGIKSALSYLCALLASSGVIFIIIFGIIYNTPYIS